MAEVTLARRAERYSTTMEDLLRWYAAEGSTRYGEPTDAPPGSERKIAVMRERATNRLPIFHPLDNLKRRRDLRGEAS